jgi:HSP20 family molecular chaperone IbpA
MNRNPQFGSPFLLGFEHIERLLERTTRAASEAYPPYNVEHLGGEKLRITIAVAGFAAEDLSVTVEDNQLVIRGKQAETEDRQYLHRGIAARQFLRSFVLAEGMEVTSAELKHGLLAIDLERPKRESLVRAIAIKKGDGHTPGKGPGTQA